MWNSEMLIKYVIPVILTLFVAYTIRKTSRTKWTRYNESMDTNILYGPIRGMFVCYECDTIFNTPMCPECHEEAVIPLIRLTGSVTDVKVKQAKEAEAATNVSTICEKFGAKRRNLLKALDSMGVIGTPVGEDPQVLSLVELPTPTTPSNGDATAEESTPPVIELSEEVRQVS